MDTLKGLRLAGLGLVVTGMLAVGCQTTLLLDDANLERELASWIEQQGSGASTVSCPDDRPLQQGDTFQCTATFPDGSTATFQVTQTDSAGNVSWVVLN